MIGTTLGRYRILEPLGKGGMGEVFLAEDPALGRMVAIKVLPREFALDRERRGRLIHEARAASALNHPNIITVHDLGESNGTIYIAVELVQGTTLRQWARAEQRTPVAILKMIRQATQALSVAHAAGLIHRDLKPDNMMVRQDGLLKILDFGLARSPATPDGGRTETMPGTVMGTAPYMSPEQVLGQKAGPPSDVFSLGTILYELLTGKHPFFAVSAVETMHRILHETPDSPSQVQPTLSPDFDFVLAKALSKDPGRRHHGAKDLDVDLETLEYSTASSQHRADGKAGNGGLRAIAVLPFKNIGGDPAMNYLGVGLADAVITLLSYSPDLIVRATSSISAYENRAVDPRLVGQELDVSAVLDASFQRSRDRFRATARLVETPSGRALWAGKVDVSFADIFDVQDQVAKGIAEALTARLSGVERGGGGSRFTPSPEAYEEFLRALESLRLGTKAGALRAVEVLEHAVRLEPGYAQAWAQLGATYQAMIDGGFDADPSWYAKGEEALARARAIDPGNALARFALGTLHLVRGQKRDAYREFSESLPLMPNVWTLYHYFAYLYRLCDMLDEGIRMELRALEIDPGLPWPYWGCIRMELLRGHVSAAREWLEKARERFGAHPRFYAMELTILCRERRDAEAREYGEKHLNDAELIGYSEFYRALWHIKLGELDLAAPHIAQCEAYGEIDMDEAAFTGILYAQLGDADKAFHYLERAVALGNDTMTLYTDTEMLGPLHADPRWTTFIEAMRRRTEQWRREFPWPLPESRR